MSFPHPVPLPEGEGEYLRLSLRERQDFVNERSEFRKSGEGYRQ